MAPNVNSVLTFSRLDGINSNGLNKEISQAEPKFSLKKIIAKEQQLLPHLYVIKHFYCFLPHFNF